jgi:Xaa-Pro aminopeptidase
MRIGSTQPLVRSGVDVAEYQSRRERVLEALAGSCAVVYAGDGSGHGAFHADPNFVYLTGITAEPGAAVLFNPAAEDPSRRISLFLKPLNPELERWDRYRDAIGHGLRETVGFKSVFRTEMLASMLLNAGRRCRKMACLASVSSINAPVPADLGAFRKVAERISGVSIEDKTQLLLMARAIKGPAEIERMRTAAKITAKAYDEAVPCIRPGANERDIQRVLELNYLDNGADPSILPGGHAYEPIVGAGINACVLHYRENNQLLNDGDLLLIDSAARFENYCADVTRTFPISGRFTAVQRQIYDIVLRAQEAAIRACKPGAYIWQVDKAARDVITKAGFGDVFIHGTGHYLGMDVHDAMPDGPFKPGMVFTIEPGIYLPDGYKGSGPIGIRIEDDILITSKGHENLTSMIPKTASDVERWVSGGLTKRRR